MNFLRTVAASLFLLVAASFTQAASYEVFMVRGEVIYEFSGESLTPGMTIASGERVKFKDKNAFAVVFSDGMRLTISAKNLGDKFRPGEFVVVKKATKRGNSGLHARPAGALDSEKKIDAYFNEKPFLLLGESTVKMAAPKYPLNKDTYMFLRYKIEGEFMMATKVLKHHHGQVVINSDEIVEIGKKGSNIGRLSNFELHHFGGPGKMSKVCDLDLVLVDQQAMMEEIGRLATLLREALGADSMDEETMKQEVLDYLVEYYGVPDQESFDEFAQQAIN